jgi:hypothetical protein
MARMAAGLVLGLLITLGACSDQRADSSRVSSQRERDSVLGASRLPGAQGVRGALGASDSAAARNARLDSIARQR